MRIALLLTALILAFLIASPGAPRAGPALVFEPASGAVLHAHEPARRWYPASLVKLMTLYLAFEAMESSEFGPDSPVVLSERAVAVTANPAGFPAGAEVTLEETILILAVHSANDMAVAVAEALAGSLEAFVAEMNRAAARLDMRDTRFVNPHGLHHRDQYTSARDLALLATAMLRRFPQHSHLFATRAAEVRGRPLQSFNRLIGAFPGADGMKTGFVCASGYNMVASATRDGRRIAAVMLGALSQDEREVVAMRLLEAGFAAASGTAGRPSLERLAPSPGAAARVDMRPYACEGRRPPAELASFGLDPPRAAAPLPRPRPAPPPGG